MNLSLYFRALIFFEENKIGTFYFDGALIAWTLCSMQQSLISKYQQDLYFFPENQGFKNKMIDFSHHVK